MNLHDAIRRACEKPTIEDAVSSSAASTLLDVPCGWKRGEPLVVSKRKAWYVEQQPKFNFDRKIEVDHIAYRWFYTFDEFAKFLRWWYEAI